MQHPRKLELYSYWTWILAFLAASIAGSPHALNPAPSRTASVSGFAIIAVGGIGCVWGGAVADRIGRPRLVIIALSVSAICCALVGLAFGRSLWLLTPVALVWGFFIIADSAHFSVLVTESVPPHAVGTALILQTSQGIPADDNFHPTRATHRAHHWQALGLRLSRHRPGTRHSPHSATAPVFLRSSVAMCFR